MKIGLSLVLGAALIAQGCTSLQTPPAQDNTPESGPVTKAKSEVTPPVGEPKAKSPVVAAEQKEIKPAPQAPQAKAEKLTGELLYYLLSAEIAGQRGYLDIAVPFYLKAAEISRDASIVERATRVAVYARDEKNALKASLLWVEVSPEKSEAHQVAAALLVRNGRIDEALPHMEWVLNHHSNEENGYMLITSLLSKEKDKQHALEAMEKLIAKRPKDYNALYAYGHLAMLVGSYNKAEEAVEKVLLSRPDWTDAHILRANILIRKGDDEKVLRLLKQAVNDMPENTVLRTYYARKLVDEKQFAAAKDQFEVVLEYKTDDPDALFSLGLLNLQMEKAKKAKSYLQRLVDIGQRVDEAHYYLGQSEEYLKQDDRAVTHYKEIHRGKNYIDAQIRIAVIQARQGNIEAARERLQSVSAPTLDVELRLYLAEGEILRSAGRYQEAVDVFNAALQQMPDNTQLLYSRALLYEKLDRIDEAISDLEKIVNNEPKNAEALNALGYTLVDQTHRVREGLGYIERAFKLKPGDAAILDSLGWAYYRLGEHARALEFLKQAFDKLKDPEIAAHLGEVLWVQGDQESARRIWKDALRETPSDKVLLNVIERFTE